MAFIPTVDQEKCRGCEECVDICSAEVFEMRGGKAEAVHQDRCVGCESCVEVCENHAITVTDTRHKLSDQCAFLFREILAEDEMTG